MDSLKQLKSISGLNKNRWQLALVTIFSLRAFFSSYKKIAPEDGSVEVVTASLSIDKSSLTQLVNDKDLDQLVSLGGVEGLVSALNTNLEHGIHADSDDISRRQEFYGINIYPRPCTKGFFGFVVEQLKDKTIIIILVCGGLSLGCGMKTDGPKEGWYNGASTFVLVFFAISVSAVINLKISRQFYKLSMVSYDNQVEVHRNRNLQRILVTDIVVGDVVCLKSGDQVPADGLFAEGHSLVIDEASMTGESDPVEVNHDKNPFLLSGTKVVDGYAKFLVTSVGMNTTWGKMMSSTSRDSSKKTPLQARLHKLTSLISKIGVGIDVVLFVALLVSSFTSNSEDEQGKTEFDRVVGILADALNTVVAVIPEGLPLAVTLSLYNSLKRMVADQAMVRKMSACETIGSATTICTDKTGTLTLNQMKVSKFLLGQESIEESNFTSIASSVMEFFQQGVGLNTSGNVYKPNLGSDLEFSGSPTEKALLSWGVSELNMDTEELKESYELLHEKSFNSEKKRSGILLKKKADNTLHVHWKGAAEMIIAMCTQYYDSLGNIKAMEDTGMEKFNQLVQGMAASSLRCIAFAHTEVSEHEYDDEKTLLKDNNLTLLGLVGLKDTCRPGVRKAIQDCQHAGVNVKMLTGDNVFTAIAIATECGILKVDQNMDEVVVEGVEFRNYTEAEQMEKVDKICVMARSLPSDKLLMVKCLKQKGHVVAVFGDGTNDAPALKEADIGLSLGIQGTRVAKESSDIVILDDNFASVATVIKWGRYVYNNIQKFLQFQLTVNLVTLVTNLVVAVSSGDVPLSSVQLLWVNLIMDTLGALALATEQPSKELMNKRPVGRTEPIISNIMWRNLTAQALFQIAVLLTLQFNGKAIFGVGKDIKDTLLFNTFVLCQVFNELNARNLENKNIFEGIHKSKMFLGIMGITVLIQVVMVEFLKKYAGTERLNWGQWGVCIGIAILSWPIGFLVKYIPVPEKAIFQLSVVKEVKEFAEKELEAISSWITN
ncbi:Calcium-transporting ATPase [Heracleum sosnowskyi]|uniref:Calcium-transporting ATPase n=1 Tax=Heracleum sosnowskyi TaxID=360622 RepID=A0AAD8MNV7_9APIA|nr:Calcium-transporting ATPase [Heracleum sosnowskyi]